MMLKSRRDGEYFYGNCADEEEDDDGDNDHNKTQQG
jgi:hypothetical protein